MAYENILVEKVGGGVRVITLNRPDVLNALSSDLNREMDEALDSFENDPDIKAIVITGAGEKAFSAGADIHENARRAEGEARQSAPPRPDASWRRATFKKPTIGAINGLCWGGAAVLASSLDIRIGCERTNFRFIAAARGRINNTWSLPIVVGWARAKELLFTARVVDAEEAEHMGLLNKIVPSERLMDEVIEMGRMIAKNDELMVQGIKQILHEHIGREWRAMYDGARDAVKTRFQPGSFQVGFADFLERKGRNRV